MIQKPRLHFLSAVILLLSSCSSEAVVAFTETPTPTTPVPALPSLTSIPSGTQEKLIRQLDFSQMDVNEWASTSPDGIWVAAGLVAFPRGNVGGQLAYVRLMIFGADGKAHLTIIDEWEETGLGFP